MSMTTRVTHSALVFVAAMLLVSVGSGQDPVAVAPDHYKILLENKRVRVLEGLLKPGERTPLHSHPARVIYILSDEKARFTFPGGRTVDSESKAGEVVWREPTTHAEENIGTTDSHAIIVELKEPGH
jgi:quercetin dioxygenase-like cupin family protein